MIGLPICMILNGRATFFLLLNMASAKPFAIVILRFPYNELFSGNATLEKYSSGMVKEIRFDLDMLSYMDLLKFCKEEGFQNINRILWLHPRKTLRSGLRLVWNDKIS